MIATYLERDFASPIVARPRTLKVISKVLSWDKQCQHSKQVWFSFRCSWLLQKLIFKVFFPHWPARLWGSIALLNLKDPSGAYVPRPLCRRHLQSVLHYISLQPLQKQICMCARTLRNLTWFLILLLFCLSVCFSVLWNWTQGLSTELCGPFNFYFEIASH